MLILDRNIKINVKHVEFVSYDGRYPSLCMGTLVLKINGKKISFGDNKNDNYPSFWRSGGCAGYSSGEWMIAINEIPVKYQKYAEEIDVVFNNNVRYGCCGGCA